jgi:plasma kallikrein
MVRQIFSSIDSLLLTRLIYNRDTQTTAEILPHSDHEIDQIIIHPDFGQANLYNDIALIVLKNPAQLAVHINTVCLPPQNFKFDGENCFASGWGTDKFGRNDLYRVNLKKLELPAVPLRDCQESLRTTKLGPRFKIHTNFMCAGGERDVDTCTGDGGSPLGKKFRKLL